MFTNNNALAHAYHETLRNYVLTKVTENFRTPQSVAADMATLNKIIQRQQTLGYYLAFPNDSSRQTKVSYFGMPIFNFGMPNFNDQTGWRGMLSGRTGQVGLGFDMPGLATLFPNQTILALEASLYHAIILTDQGLFGLGKSDQGQFGTQVTKTPGQPQKITFFGTTETSPVLAIAVGTFHTMVLTANGHLYGFGCNQFGQLGAGGTAFGVHTPQRVAFPLDDPNPTIIGLTTGADHTIVVTTKYVYGFGKNESGALGEPCGNVLIPRKIPVLNNKIVFDAAAGSGHSLFLTTEGVYGLGANQQGQIGQEDMPRGGILQPLSFFRDKQVLAVAAGDKHSLALMEEIPTGNRMYGFTGQDVLYGFGLNHAGQLENQPGQLETRYLGGKQNSPNPMLQSPQGSMIFAITAGFDFCRALTLQST